jgi:hypothetical protein
MNIEENRPKKERIMKNVKYFRTSNRFHCSLKDRLRLLKHSETEYIHMSALRAKRLRLGSGTKRFSNYLQTLNIDYKFVDFL